MSDKTQTARRSLEQHIRDFILIARASRDSVVAMQAVVLQNRLKEQARERARFVDTTGMVPAANDWRGL